MSSLRQQVDPADDDYSSQAPSNIDTISVSQVSMSHRSSAKPADNMTTSFGANFGGFKVSQGIQNKTNAFEAVSDVSKSDIH